jgi:xylan 1,4-beta-xylosidase
MGRKTEIMPALLTNMAHLPSSLLLAALLGIPAVRAGPAAAAPVATPSSFPVTLDVDAAHPVGKLTPVWRFFGYDEANYTYMKVGRKLLSELGQLGGPQVFIRCHHLLTSGDGSPALKWGSTGVYTEDAEGKPVYNWAILDRIFDTYLERGLKPYAQIGFMPETLSVHPENYPHHPPTNEMAPVNAGQAYPPKDYAKWGELVYAWVRHCLERYGSAEVAQWYWEVWNEPNISYWQGKPEDYFKLYDYAVDGVRRALPGARVGGPESAGGPGGQFLRQFLEHCAHGTNYVTGQPGSPLDFISFHAKGHPEFVDGHVRMGMASQFRNIDDAFAVVASFREYKNTPLVIGESDPDGCAACTGPQNGYRNGTMYSSYTAASFGHEFEFAEKHGVNFEGVLTWAFEFEDQPYFAGFRALASNGLDLPVLNIFRMFAKMSGQRLAVRSSASLTGAGIQATNVRAAPDVSAQASLDDHKLAVIIWHYHDDDVPGPAAAVDLNLTGLPAAVTRAKLTQYRIDAEHSNSYAAWLRLGSPAHPTSAQYAELEKSGQLALLGNPENIRMDHGSTLIQLQLPRQAVSLLVLEW